MKNYLTKYLNLHNQSYREKYLEFLKIDFPRVPITTNKEEFYKYANLGKQLARLHLMEEVPEDKAVDYEAFINKKEVNLSKLIKEDFIIEKISYKDNTLTLTESPNKQLAIKGVPEEVWDYKIGSYKVIDKWLKYRKNDKVVLTEEDINHIIDMAIILKETIKLQKEISSLPLPS